MPSVMQDWVNELSFMQQTVIITAIRGCDGLPKRHISKFLLRWYRRCVLLSAFDKCVLSSPWDKRGGNFTGPLPPAVEDLDSLVTQYFDSVDEVPHHFQMHVLHAAEILGYKHPDESTRRFWLGFYNRGVNSFHMMPETEDHLDFRLGDVQKQWQAAGGETLDVGRE